MNDLSEVELISNQDNYVKKVKESRKRLGNKLNNEQDFGSINVYNEEKFNLWLNKPEVNLQQKSAIWGNFYRDAQGNIYPDQQPGTELLPALIFNNTGPNPEDNFPIFEMGVRPDGDGGQKGVFAFFGKDATSGQIKQLATIELNAFENISTRSFGAGTEIFSGDNATKVNDNTTVDNVVTNEGMQITQITKKDVAVAVQNYSVPDVRETIQTFTNPAGSNNIASAIVSDKFNTINNVAEFNQSTTLDDATQEIAINDLTTNSRNSVKLVTRSASSTINSTNTMNYTVNNVKLMTMRINTLNEPYDPSVLVGLDAEAGSVYVKAPEVVSSSFIAGLDADSNVVKVPSVFLFEGIDKQIEELEAENARLSQQMDELRQLVLAKLN